ncbi:hypothetical protein PENTCL1PPCAC_9544 [Pristionchus entomophagus]|uniref:NHR domain-containing protein n=1 Tax=Pristionchus entomophagus TaxID=358040 RepID=A0AAV5T4B2_9BILA|nr:hypothetical protein PENTCL1PPCAC_9544 [Pristionchus entomophagus]
MAQPVSAHRRNPSTGTYTITAHPIITSVPANLKFHSSHGEYIALESGDRRAVRSSANKWLNPNGIAFSDRPISTDERVRLRLSGFFEETKFLCEFRFGVTYVDPTTLKINELCSEARLHKKSY